MLAYDRALQDRLAFDFSEPNRTFDKDGRLHVKVSNITKANVCEYLGSEIPNATALGLKAEQLYKLWRHPEELQKALPTANNIQLLQKHIAVSSADPKKMDTVGSTGTDATWCDPYIQNSLVIWDDAAIRGVTTMKQGQLSSSYYYIADMTPGATPAGEPYDGVMREISFNHVALVELGRAGSDVIVGDSAIIFKDTHMIKRKVALDAYAESAQLAADAALVKAKTEPHFKVVAAKLAKDAAKAKDAAEACDEDMDMSDDADLDDETEEEKRARLAAAAKDKKARDKKAADKAAKDKAAKDEEDEDETPEEKKTRETREKAEEAEKEVAEDNKAMDAMIASVKADAKALREAERILRPEFGELAMDDATSMFKFALGKRGVDLKGVPESAYGAIYKALPAPARVNTARVAMDSAGAESFEKRFPDAARIASA